MFRGTVLYIPRSDAIRHAARHLADIGIPMTEKCAPDVTHMLLPVPSFPQGDTYLAHYLAELPDDVIISGGNLHSPLLEHMRTVDFLQDATYLADNAAITADCAAQMLHALLSGLPGRRILILGWGRIGKCLGQKLRHAGADITIAVRKPADLAIIRALGCHSLGIADVPEETRWFDAIVNTVPVPILIDPDTKPDCVLLELASRPGIIGPGVVNGRGLPGKMAPEASGKLIADTFVRLSL